MDNLFSIRSLTTAVNEIKTAESRVFDRLFRGKAHMEVSSRLAFDVISGSEGILNNISVAAPAVVTKKTGRRVVTLEAPRVASKRFIATSDLGDVRAYGSQVRVELMADRIATEQLDMRNVMDRTLEFWAVNALKGKIYDADLSTVLVDYGLDAGHAKTLAGGDLWSAGSTSDPLANLREWKLLIEDDSAAAITGWLAFCGYEVMDALIKHPDVVENLKTQRGVQLLETGRVEIVAGVEFQEYNGSFVDDGGTRRRFVDPKQVILVGLCADLTDCPYAPIVDDEASGGVGNVDQNGRGVLFFSKSWQEKDPSGRWIKSETRPLPVLQRPGAVVVATVC